MTNKHIQPFPYVLQITFAFSLMKIIIKTLGVSFMYCLVIIWYSSDMKSEFDDVVLRTNRLVDTLDHQLLKQDTVQIISQEFI